jgi:hypothetical protein
MNQDKSGRDRIGSVPGWSALQRVFLSSVIRHARTTRYLAVINEEESTPLLLDGVDRYG